MNHPRVGNDVSIPNAQTFSDVRPQHFQQVILIGRVLFLDRTFHHLDEVADLKIAAIGVGTDGGRLLNGRIHNQLDLEQALDTERQIQQIDSHDWIASGVNGLLRLARSRTGRSRAVRPSTRW